MTSKDEDDWPLTPEAELNWYTRPDGTFCRMADLHKGDVVRCMTPDRGDFVDPITKELCGPDRYVMLDSEPQFSKTQGFGFECVVVELRPSEISGNLN